MTHLSQFSSLNRNGTCKKIAYKHKRTTGNTKSGFITPQQKQKQKQTEQTTHTNISLLHSFPMDLVNQDSILKELREADWCDGAALVDSEGLVVVDCDTNISKEESS